MLILTSRIFIGLDDKKRKWLNNCMSLEKVKKVIQATNGIFGRGKSIRVSPEDKEYQALREQMKGQFKQLKDKGLSIRIITL